MCGYCDKCGKLLIGESYSEVLDKDGKVIWQICLDCEEEAVITQ